MSIINNKDFVWYNKYQLENFKYYIDKRIKLYNLKISDKQLYKLIIKKNYQETVNNIYRLLLLSDKNFLSFFDNGLFTSDFSSSNSFILF